MSDERLYLDRKPLKRLAVHWRKLWRQYEGFHSIDVDALWCHAEETALPVAGRMTAPVIVPGAFCQHALQVLWKESHNHTTAHWGPVSTYYEETRVTVSTHRSRSLCILELDHSPQQWPQPHLLCLIHLQLVRKFLICIIHFIHYKCFKCL